jgi:P-type Ca2+ transporter type 2C
MLFQIFNVFNARSDDRSAFAHLFTNRWLWAAVAGSVIMQILVVYVPFLQNAFGTTPLSGRDWLVCVTVASSVLWLREASKAMRQWLDRRG